MKLADLQLRYSHYASILRIQMHRKNTHYRILPPTNPMKQSPREPYSYSSLQDIPYPLWNPTVHYSVRNIPLDLLLSQMNPVHIFPSFTLTN
jgi:hypothetical protein